MPSKTILPATRTVQVVNLFCLLTLLAVAMWAALHVTMSGMGGADPYDHDHARFYLAFFTMFIVISNWPNAPIVAVVPKREGATNG